MKIDYDYHSIIQELFPTVYDLNPKLRKLLSRLQESHRITGRGLINFKKAEKIFSAFLIFKNYFGFFTYLRMYKNLVETNKSIA